jgi:hypothetical protein
MAHVIIPPMEELADDVSASTSTYKYTNVTANGSGSGSTYSNVTLGGGFSNTGITYTSGTTFASPWANTASPWLGNGITSDPAGTGRLKLSGEGADVEINGKSLTKTIQALEQRLNILIPNPELEKDWKELRVLGEQYRALEAKLNEQGEMWNKLKAMPPPDIK